MSVLRKLASQTVIFGAGHVLAKVLSIILTPLLLSVASLGSTAYGAFTQLYAFVSFINVILIFGMETTFFRFLQDTDDPREVYNQAWIWVALMAGIFMAIIMPLGDSLAAFFDAPGQGIWIRLLAGVIVLDVVAAMPLARLRQQEKAGQFSLILIINVLLTLGLNYLFLVVLEYKDLSYIFLANLIASTAKLILSLIGGNLPTSLKPKPSVLRPMLAYGFFIMIAGFAGIMNETLDRAMLPKLWPDGGIWEGVPRTGLEMNGIYGANYKVAMLIQLAIQAFRYAAEPFFFKQSKEKDSPETFARVFHYFEIAALIGFLFIASFAQEIVSFDFFGLFQFYDEEFQVGLSIVPVLLLAYVFSGAYLNMSIWFKITKQVRFAILFTGTGALITILVNVLTIPTYGYLGSAWATLICYLVMSTMVYFVGQRYYPIPYRVGRLLIYAGVFIGLFFINRTIGPTEGYWLAFLSKFLLCLVGIGVVFIGEKYFSPFTNKTSE